MKRINVTVPDELLRQLRAAHPALNVSQVLQDALRALAACPHEQLVCEACQAVVDRRSVGARLLDALYVDLIDALEHLLFSGGTVEGAARVTKNVAERHQVAAAFRRPLPRFTRAEREAAKDRHPSNQTQEEHYAHDQHRPIPAACA